MWGQHEKALLRIPEIQLQLMEHLPAAVASFVRVLAIKALVQHTLQKQHASILCNVSRNLAGAKVWLNVLFKVVWSPKEADHNTQE